MIPENIKAVIFDLDGLLIDSEPIWADVDRELLGKRGFSPAEQLFIKRLGTGNKRTIEIYKEEFDIQEDTNELAKERTELFHILLAKHLVLMEGAKNLMQKLSNTGKKMAIATSGPYKGKIEEIILRLGIEKYISAVVTGEDVKRGKPFPDIFLLAAEKLGVAPQECLVLEDAPNGIIAAKTAGMIAFGINAKKEVQSQFAQAGADTVFSSLTEII